MLSCPSRVPLKSQFFSKSKLASFPTMGYPSMGRTAPDQTHFPQASDKPPKPLIWTISISPELWAPNICGAKMRRAPWVASVLPICLRVVEDGVRGELHYGGSKIALEDFLWGQV